MTIRRVLWGIAAFVALIAILFALFFLSKSRNFQTFGKMVARIETDKKRIALTIDDGPTLRTAEILSTLKELDIPATFFLFVDGGAPGGLEGHCVRGAPDRQPLLQPPADGTGLLRLLQA